MPDSGPRATVGGPGQKKAREAIDAAYGNRHDAARDKPELALGKMEIVMTNGIPAGVRLVPREPPWRRYQERPIHA